MALYSKTDREKTWFIQNAGIGIKLKSTLILPTAVGQITVATTAFSHLKKYSSSEFLGGFCLIDCFCINSDYRQTSRRLYHQQVSTTRAEEVSSITDWIPLTFAFHPTSLIHLLHSDEQNLCHISCNALG